MKYIRTECGIYERVMVTRQVCDGEEVAVIRYDKLEFEPIIKTADTIEELCDEFVIVGTNWQQIIDLDSAKHNAGKHEKIKIYGAIWTDKGLIYIAKMNDKGELELLWIE